MERASARLLSRRMSQYQEDQVPADAPESDLEDEGKRIPTPLSESFSSPQH